MRTRLDSTAPAAMRIPTIDELVGDANLRPVYQPVVNISNLTDPSLHGFEALTRFGGGAPIFTPDFLFTYADRKRRVVDLDLELLGRAIARAVDLPSPARLFVNIHPQTFCTPGALVKRLLKAVHESRLDPSRVVLEITEQGAFSDSARAIRMFDELRYAGVAFALDDVGIAYSHLSLVGGIRPRYMKISQEFGTGFEVDPVKYRMVRNIFRLGRDFGCEVILEGIETRSTALAASQLGITLGQGYLFGRPVPAAEARLVASAA